MDISEFEKWLIKSPMDVLNSIEMQNWGGGKTIDAKSLNPGLAAYAASELADKSTGQELIRLYTQIAVALGEIDSKERASDSDPRGNPIMTRVKYVTRYPDSILARTYLDEIDKYINWHLERCKNILSKKYSNKSEMPIEEMFRLRGLKNLLNYISMLFGQSLIKNETLLMKIWSNKSTLP